MSHSIAYIQDGPKVGVQYTIHYKLYKYFWPTLYITLTQIQHKGKAIPLQAWESPEDSRSLRLPDFKTIGT
jgi:hypothetical protein